MCPFVAGTNFDPVILWYFFNRINEKDNSITRPITNDTTILIIKNSLTQLCWTACLLNYTIQGLNGSLFLKTYNNLDSHAFKTHFAPEDITLLYKSNLVLIKM